MNVYTLDEVMFPEDGECLEEVRVEESEEEEVRGDGWLADLQVGEAGQVGQGGHEAGLLPGVPGRVLATAAGHGGRGGRGDGQREALQSSPPHGETRLQRGDNQTKANDGLP